MQQTFTELLFSYLPGPFGSVQDERINSLRAFTGRNPIKLSTQEEGNTYVSDQQINSLESGCPGKA